MLSFYATEYTIHFDDTMAYGSHHFLTAFKFQCAARESFLFGERVFDVRGVRDVLDQIHLFTADAYARNLSPTKLGDRLAIMMTLEDWGRASARFCYRVISEHGKPICAGFQTLLCADPATGNPIPLPPPLANAMEKMREIEEPQSKGSFRDRVLAGGTETASLFNHVERQTAIHFLSERYPSPQVICTAHSNVGDENESLDEPTARNEPESAALEAWVFSGQGSFAPHLLSERIVAYMRLSSSARKELDKCAAVAQELLGGDAFAVLCGSSEQCGDAVKATPDLIQVAIYIQNVLGASIRQSHGYRPGILLGHSFGEIAALGVGGCFDLPTGVRIVCERVRAIAKHAPPSGGLLAVAIDRPKVATEIDLLGLDQVVIAGRNHEQQTIASGASAQLEHLRNHFETIDVNAVLVPSPTSFHHPRLKPTALAWYERLKDLPLTKPVDPVYSPIGRRFISPNDDIAAILASQLVRPFDLQGGIADVVEAGATKFVDCGSTGALARIISKAGVNNLEISGVEIDEFDAREASSRPKFSMAQSIPRPEDREVAWPNRNERQPRVDKQDSELTSTGPVVTPIAIVGQGCILPGGVCSPAQLYSAIFDQRTGIVDQRASDIHWAEDFYSAKLVPDRSTSHLTGRVDDDDIVVPDGIDPGVFRGFTRTQRLLCIGLAPCIEALKGAERVTCLIGATADGFEDQDVVSSLRIAGLDPTDQAIHDRMNTAHSAFHEPHSAVQEVFDRIVRPGLKVTLIDAACASSLYAVALGMQSLESNETDAVIAGGVFCPGPGNSCLFSQFHGTTSTGCRPFDANADGVVFSEGSAFVTLRRVSDTEQQGLQISAVLRGVGLSSDGRSSSANVPQTHGQLLSLKRCYANYNIDPASVHAIEGHGTSTRVGDATELETLRKFFLDRTPKPIPVHSLKGLLGHAGWAAGTAALIATCEYMRNGHFPAQAYHRESSKALIESSGTLTVPHSPVSLPERQCRIAVDGFGFGGANAHVVVDRHIPEERAQAHTPDVTASPVSSEDELVCVACHEIAPTVSTPGRLRFDREHFNVLENHVLLPDLADDMDVSQKLVISLVDGIVAQIPQFDDTLRQETAVVLAQSGKTERGVEATMRVLASRFRRRLEGLDRHNKAIEAAHDHARPSGPYTLQCMMPNVSAGRAALQFNLNGPNFVVDSGSHSLEAAMASASQLLRAGDDSGTKLVIVSAVSANPWRASRTESQDSKDEFAAAFGVTTRRYAAEYGLDVVSTVGVSLQSICTARGPEQATRTTAKKVRALLDALDAKAHESVNASSRESTNGNLAAVPSDSEFPIHVSTWVEAPLSNSRNELDFLRQKTLLIVVPSDQELIAELIETLPRYTQRFMIVVVGTRAKKVASNFSSANVLSVDLDDEPATATTHDRIDEISPDIVVAVESIKKWNLAETLSDLATDNGLCEFLFLLAQQYVAKLRKADLTLCGLFLNGWNGQVHPASGPIAGMLKAVSREFPAAQVATVCTRSLSLDNALHRVFVEQLQGNHENELVYDNATRLVRRLRRPFCDAEFKPQIVLDENSVVVATGGARGVTAVMVDALLCDHGCTVVALGRSELEAGPAALDDTDVEGEFYDRFIRENPEATAADMKNAYERARTRWEAHRTIQHLSTLDGHIEYMVADVTDSEQVAKVIERVASKFGRVDLLVHGAGIQVSKRLEHRSLTDFRRTFSVKVSGLRNLVDHCRKQFGRTVSTHVLTSAYSVFGNDGQHDYGAANETLDRLCGLSKIHPDQNWSSIAWLAWDGIGMTRGSEYRALAKQRGLSGLNVETGQHVFREVFSGKTKSEINVPITEAEHVRYQVKTIPPPTESFKGRVIELSVNLSTIQCLHYHKVQGSPTLPGAWILERMVDAGLQLREDPGRFTSVVVQNATFNRFVRSLTGHEPNIRVIAEETADGIVAWMIGDILHSTGATLSKDVVFAQATLSFECEANELHSSLSDIDSLAIPTNNRSVSDPYCDGRRNDVDLSGPFDCIHDITIGATGRRARFVPNQTQNDSGVIPAFLLDSAWRVGAMYAVPNEDELYVPVHIGRLVLPIRKSAIACSASDWEIRATAPRAENGKVRWDRTEVANDVGTVKIIVEDACATRLR